MSAGAIDDRWSSASRLMFPTTPPGLQGGDCVMNTSRSRVSGEMVSTVELKARQLIVKAQWDRRVDGCQIETRFWRWIFRGLGTGCTCFSSFISSRSRSNHTHTESKDHHLNPQPTPPDLLLQNQPRQALYDLHGVLYINVLNVQQAQAPALLHLQPLRLRNLIYRHGRSGDVS